MKQTIGEHDLVRKIALQQDRNACYDSRYYRSSTEELLDAAVELVKPKKEHDEAGEVKLAPGTQGRRH